MTVTRKTFLNIVKNNFSLYSPPTGGFTLNHHEIRRFQMRIENFKPTEGNHCVTNSLKQIFEYNNYSISEEMLFGIGAGLGFVYVNLKQSPMISCRIKPGEFEKNVANQLDIKIKMKKPTSIKAGIKNLNRNLINNIPTMIYVDMAYLDYLNMNSSSHFGGHSIVVFGYDTEKKHYYVSDRDSALNKIHTPKGLVGKDYHLFSENKLIKAWSSSYRPFPANNKWVDFDFSNAKKIDNNILKKSIEMNMFSMLNAPAYLLGIKGIYKFSKEIRKWEKYNAQKIKMAGITNYFMINKDGGTGGGAFRKMYGNFLIEASDYIQRNEIGKFGKDVLVISDLWDEVGYYLFDLNINNIKHDIEKISEKISKIAEHEHEVYSKVLRTITA